MRAVLKSRQLLISISLIVLVLAGLMALFLTRDLGTAQLAQTPPEESGPPPLVDESPLQTARAMRKLASEGDQQKIAAQAEELADNEVDLAFRDASRDAADHPPQAKTQFRPLFQRVGQIETDVQTDQAQLFTLTRADGSPTTASGARQKP